MTTPPLPPKVDVPVTIPVVVKPITSSSGFNISAGSFIGIILFAIGLAAAAYIYASVGKTDALTDYKNKLKAYESTVVAPALKRADSLETIAADAKKIVDHSTVVASNQTAKIRILRDSANTLDSHNKELESKLGSLPDTSVAGQLIDGLKSEVVIQHKTIDSLDTRDSTRLVTIAGLRVQVLSYKTVADSLKDVIRKWPVPGEPKKIFGFLPQLTPKQAAITSAVLGVIVGYKLHR